jgi:hypothetical protein
LPDLREPLADLAFGSTVLKQGGIYVDIAGSNKLASPLQVMGSGLTIARKLLQPTWLGGVPRKYSVVAAPPDKHSELLNEIVAMVDKGQSFPRIVGEGVVRERGLILPCAAVQGRCRL